MGYKNKTGLEYQREYYLKIKDKGKQKNINNINESII
jgi:hypothetical protein